MIGIPIPRGKILVIAVEGYQSLDATCFSVRRDISSRAKRMNVLLFLSQFSKKYELESLQHLVLFTLREVEIR